MTLDIDIALYFLGGIITSSLLFQSISGALLRMYYPFFLMGISFQIILTVASLKNYLDPAWLMTTSLVYPLFAFILSDRTHNDHSQFYLSRKLGSISLGLFFLQALLLLLNLDSWIVPTSFCIQWLYFSHSFVFYKKLKNSISSRKDIFFKIFAALFISVFFYCLLSIIFKTWNTSIFIFSCAFISLQGLMIVFFYLTNYYILVESGEKQLSSMYLKNLRILNSNKTLSNRLLALENKAINNHLNPHFLFNSINSINSLIINNELNKASKYLDELLNLLHKIYKQNKTSFISLKEEFDILKIYIELENLRRDEPIHLDFNIGPELSSDRIYLPLFLIQVFIENSIWHGIPNAQKGIIQISVSKVNQMLEIVILDNGKGLQTNTLKSEYESAGINLVKNKLKSLEAYYEQKTSIGIHNIPSRMKNDSFKTGVLVEIKTPLISSPPSFSSFSQNQDELLA